MFVPGAFPSLTFNARLTTDLQDSITRYLATGQGTTLLVHGASKTGKTVLVERWLNPDSAIWIKGDEITSVNELYGRIIDDLGLFTETTVSQQSTDSGGGDAGIEAGIGQVLRFKMGLNAQISESYGTVTSRRAMNVSVVKAALRNKPVPIVIDDFHFIDHSLRVDVAKAIKDLARLTRVVLIAIPHAVFEPLQRLQDLDWRVSYLEVKSWATDELIKIAHDGFPLLGIVDHSDAIGDRLAQESRGAPAIMQTLCLEYSTQVLGVWVTRHPAVDASTPPNWDAFMTRLANERKPVAFEKLKSGKETRGVSRTARTLYSGEVTDIYGAVLYTLAQMGVLDRVSKSEVAHKMSELVQDAPTASVISGTLVHLAEIAETMRGQSDPALSYQDPDLQILDPFLGFYLAHGEWALPRLPH